MRIYVPPQVNKALEILEQNGHKGFVVGGCLRDSFLGKEPTDWDIATSAKPEEIILSFSEYKVLPTGMAHGTVTVILGDFTMEITTFRIDGEYNDNRHPERVMFTNSIEDDLSRRDFTVNAMAYNPFIGFIDPFGGREDIGKGIVKTVGDSDKRFREDALRIMRGLRFASDLGFDIEEKTGIAIRENRELLNNIALERINIELCKLLIGKNAGKVLMEYRDVIGVIIPEVERTFDLLQKNPHHIYNVWEHTCHSIEESPRDKEIRLALFFHDIGKGVTFSQDESGMGHFYGHSKISSEMAENIMRRLKFDNKTREKVVKLVLYHDLFLETTEKYVRHWLHRLGEEAYFKLLEIKRADVLAQSEFKRDEKLKSLDNAYKIGVKIRDEKQCLSLKNLAVSGDTLIEAGYEQGPNIGTLLNEVLDKVLDGELVNSKEDIMDFIANLTKSNNN